MESEKKIFAKFLKLRLSDSYITEGVCRYSSRFKVYKHDSTQTAVNYVLGLFKCPKGEANMERMEEQIPDSEYRAYQHFISNSNWDTEGLLEDVALDCSRLFCEQKKKNKKPIGYIIDESGHLKKGKMSVGVARQYAGVSGKVDNCQVGVYASLVNDKYASIINERLFLPKSWTDDPKKCNPNYS